MNPFEQHLKNNKDKLDLDKVSPEVWLSIENEVLKKKNRRVSLYLKIAAAAAVLLFLTVAINTFTQSENQDVHRQLIELYNLQEYEFPQKINTKKASLSDAKIPVDKEKDFQILVTQLKFLDQQYENYLGYIEANGYQEFIGEQILNYYKNKLELLDKIQSEIKRIESYENEYDKNSPKVKLKL